MFQFQGVENDLIDPHSCIVLSISMQMSLSFEILYLVCVPQGQGTSPPPTALSPQLLLTIMNRKYRT